MAEVYDLQFYRETGEIKSPEEVEKEIIESMPDLDEIATVMMTRFHLTQKEGPAAQWLWRLLESPLSNESLPEGRGLWYVHLMPEVTTNSGHRSCSTRRSRQASTLVLKDTPSFQCQLKGLL